MGSGASEGGRLGGSIPMNSDERRGSSCGIFWTGAGERKSQKPPDKNRGTQQAARGLPGYQTKGTEEK